MNLMDEILCPKIWRDRAEKRIKNIILNEGSKNVLFYLVKNDSIFIERFLPVHSAMCRGFDFGINFAQCVLKNNNATAMIFGMPTFIVNAQENKKVEKSNGYVIHYENGVSVITKIYKVLSNNSVSIFGPLSLFSKVRHKKKYKLELFKEEFNIRQPFSHTISKFIPICLN